LVETTWPIFSLRRDSFVTSGLVCVASLIT
jgi:hypothetical protein